MKIIESREHELLSFSHTEAANESPFELDRAAAAPLSGSGAAQPPARVGASAGWSPYEVWRTRVSRLAPADDTRSRN